MTPSELVLYRTEDGRTRIQCRFEDSTLWLTQAQMAELFQTTPQNITLHLKAIFEEGELAEQATCKEYLQVRREGQRDVTRSLRHYSLPAILAVGMSTGEAAKPSLFSVAPCLRGESLASGTRSSHAPSQPHNLFSVAPCLRGESFGGESS